MATGKEHRTMSLLTIGLAALLLVALLTLRMVTLIASDVKALHSSLAGAATSSAQHLEKIASVLQGIKDDLGISGVSSSTIGDRVAGINEAVWEMIHAQEREALERENREWEAQQRATDERDSGK
jgi:membrane-bound lytic murein transglycosylase B